jgi:hypothetical protein
MGGMAREGRARVEGPMEVVEMAVEAEVQLSEKQVSIGTPESKEYIWGHSGRFIAPIQCARNVVETSQHRDSRQVGCLLLSVNTVCSSAGVPLIRLDYD